MKISYIYINIYIFFPPQFDASDAVTLSLTTVVPTTSDAVTLTTVVPTTSDAVTLMTAVPTFKDDTDDTRGITKDDTSSPSSEDRSHRNNIHISTQHSTVFKPSTTAHTYARLFNISTQPILPSTQPILPSTDIHLTSENITNATTHITSDNQLINESLNRTGINLFIYFLLFTSLTTNILFIAVFLRTRFKCCFYKKYFTKTRKRLLPAKSDLNLTPIYRPIYSNQSSYSVDDNHIYDIPSSVDDLYEEPISHTTV